MSPRLSLLVRYNTVKGSGDILHIYRISDIYSIWRSNLLKELFRYLDFQVNLPKVAPSLGSKHLDLGCGAKPRNPFEAEVLFGTDFSGFGSRLDGDIHFVSADLTKPLPFAADSFSSISAYDVLEHIPRWERLSDGSIVFPFVDLMQEIYRVLKPNGIFYAVTPGYPSKAAFQDPTHINFITRETLAYFSGYSVHADNLGYGFDGKFDVLHNSWLKGDGPFSQKRINLGGGKTKFFSKDSLRLANRIYKLIRNRNPEHILWVIQKN
jgi:SAM-dependent methyltransferase